MKNIDLEKEFDCPFEYEGIAHLKNEVVTKEYRGEEFSYTYYWYECDKCGEKFTTTESDNLWMDELRDLYRKRHNIPSAAELIALRQQCGLSASKMSAMLGLGINQYRLYEEGEVPSLTIGKILYALCHSKSTLNLYMRMFQPELLDGHNKYIHTEEPALQCVAEPGFQYRKKPAQKRASKKKD